MTEFNSDKFLRRISVSEVNSLLKHQISGFRTVRALNGNESEVFAAVPVTGDNLKHLSILSGDLLIVKITKHFNEANLYVWDSPDGRRGMFAEESCAEIVLHNGDGWRRTYQKSDGSMLGVVVRVERDLQIRQ